MPFLALVPDRKRAVVDVMLARGVQTIATSSCGRLFDAVSAILGVRLETNFEGQAAMELECIAAPGVEESYPFEAEGTAIDFRPTIQHVVADMKEGVLPGVISARFHNTVAAVVVETCQRIRTAERLNRVCLSGGTFQNRRLTERCLQLLSANGFAVYLHAQVPPNDGGISLGQAVIASNFV